MAEHPLFYVCYPSLAEETDYMYILSLRDPQWFGRLQPVDGEFLMEIIRHFGPEPSSEDLARSIKEAEVFVKEYFGDMGRILRF